MKRRRFLKTTATGLAGSSLLAGCRGSSWNEAPQVQTQPHVQWRLISSYPQSLETLDGAIREVARVVEASTEGRFQIRVFPAGELVPGTEVLGAVQNGTADAGYSPGYYYVGLNPALAFDTGVPFGLTARQQIAWFRHGGGLDLLRSLYADFGVVNFPGGNTGAQMGGWFRHPVDSLEAMKGIKMRIPGLGGKVMNELGVTVQLLAAGEVYQALDRGTIDAAEWAGPYDDIKLGLHEIAPYYYSPGWWEPGPNVSFLVNRRAWDALPKAYQECFRSATALANIYTLADYDARNQQAFGELLEGDVTLKTFPKDMLLEAERISMELMQALAAEDPVYRRVLDSFLAFREHAFLWFGTATLSFAAYAYPRMNAPATS